MSYSDNTEYAMRNLIHLVMQEEVELQVKLQLLQSAEQQLKVWQWDFETSDLNEDFSDGYIMHAFARAARAREEVSTLEHGIESLEASARAKEHSIQVMCGSILQIVRQGISFVHGRVADAPSGRFIETISLKDIIWQARNQAMHYEDDKFSDPVVNLFEKLAASSGQQFSLTFNAGKCLAKEVVCLLGWQTYDDYIIDAKLLGLVNA